MKYKHFIITQFNLLSFPLGNQIKEGEQWLIWTRERISIFKKYCLPSLDNQTNKNFTWLIFFDKQTPEEFNDIILELEKRVYVKVCFSAGNDGFMMDHINEIKRQSKEAEWVISSRIDNDDIFHKDAIQVIQNNFIPKDNYLVSLTSGYTLNLYTRQMGHYYYPASPFISIIERADKGNLNSIYCRSHASWEELKLKVFREIFKKNTSSKFVVDKPYWIQLIHGRNVSNSANRGMPVIKRVKLTEYALDFENKKRSIFSVFSFCNYAYWKRYVRGVIVRLYQNF